MSLSIDDIIGKATPPVRSTRVCLDGNLWAEHDRLTQEIDTLRAQNRGKMGDSTEVAERVADLQRVEQAMRDAEVEFKFRGLSAYKRDEIIAAYPAKEGRGWDTTAGAHALLAAASVEPKMDEAQARRLIEAVHYGVTTKLFNCAWSATEGSFDVPFSARAYASIAASA